jgi:tetratricopeptide (TPR) repeat protein
MAYRLQDNTEEYYVDQEFDRLDRRLWEGDFETVRRHCSSIIESQLEPDDRKIWGHALLGLVELVEGQFDKAYYHCLLGARASEPIRSRAIAGVAYALIGRGCFNDAETLLKSFLESSPDSGVAWHALGSCYAASNRTQEAWSCLARAWTLCPRGATSLPTLASLGLCKERCNELATILGAACVVDPANLDARGVLAAALLLMGDRERARQELERVMAFAPLTKINTQVLALVRESFASAARM